MRAQQREAREALEAKRRRETEERVRREAEEQAWREARAMAVETAERHARKTHLILARPRAVRAEGASRVTEKRQRAAKESAGFCAKVRSEADPRYADASLSLVE